MVWLLQCKKHKSWVRFKCSIWAFQWQPYHPSQQHWVHLVTPCFHSYTQTTPKLISNLATQNENAKNIYFSEIKFLPDLPCYTPLSNHSCQQLWQQLWLTDWQSVLSDISAQPCTTQQFVQANTRMVVKGQAFPWKQGGSQTAMPGPGHTAGVCVCVG